MTSPQVNNDTNNNNNSSSNSASLVKPPSALFNKSPYDHQLLLRLLPRHITTEAVVFSHKTKVGGRSLYFFSPASKGGLTKPVFTTKEKLGHLMDFPCQGHEDDDDSESDKSPIRRKSCGSPSLTSRGARRRKEEIVPGQVCTMKRIHLADPACDFGVSVWRGRGPQRGLHATYKPPSGLGPAVLVEAQPHEKGVFNNMAVAAGFEGEIMYLVPHHGTATKTDLEARATEILVQEAMLTCICESVFWFTVKSYTRKKMATYARPFHHNQKMGIGKLNLLSQPSKDAS